MSESPILYRKFAGFHYIELPNPTMIEVKILSIPIHGMDNG